ncbi:MAG: polysaccharide deacetylase family protein [Prolixibacteraceae bacterium]|jgi:peptidoglycan/xylan/chitin deacetylase (PgdA/CDA1 family)|nr:polysaccharide deacetylase family protein [Prolixibacteraceae bacterium]
MRKRYNLKIHFPAWITSLFPSAIWCMPAKKKTVYLTFDDGPIPDITPKVLAILKKYNIKATFFCVGENVQKHPAIYQQIINQGHAVGNHTFNHIRGFKVKNKNYLNNIEKAGKLIESNLFRPPHGTLKKTQYNSIIKKYKLIMWDVISCDYDPRLTPKQCYNNVIDFVRNGSIITFHDSIKAKNNVLNALPLVIEKLIEEGYLFSKIEFPKSQTVKMRTVPNQLHSMKKSINRLLKGA